MNLEKIQDVETRFMSAKAAVDAAFADLEPLTAAHARGQQAVIAAQRALEPIAQERDYLRQQYQLESTASNSRAELSQARAIFELPPPGARRFGNDPPTARSLGEDALREACAHVWLDRDSDLRFGLASDYVTVSTDDPAALKALNEHVAAIGGGYRKLVEQFPRRMVVRD